MSPVLDTISVLHVDDEPDFAEMAARFLERENDRFDVRTATSPDEGWGILEAEDVDCIVSDYEMPDRTGIEFLEAVRKRHPDLPFILYTGKGSEEVASEAISAGVTDYLQKGAGTDQYAILANRIENATDWTRAQRERQRQLDAIETANEGISILDENGRFMYVNRAYADLYGYERDEMVGEHWELIYPAEDVPRIRDILSEIDATGSWHGTTTGLRKDGSTFIEDHSLALSEHGELICTVRDISDRRDRERELEAAKRRFDAVFHNPIAFMTILEPDGTVIEVNETALEFVDRSADDVRGEPFPETPWWTHSERLQDDLRSWIERAAAGEVVRFEGSHHAPDGERITVDGVLYPIRDEEGSVVSILGAGRDISERKEHERRLEALNRAVGELVTAESKAEIAEIGVEKARNILGLSANAIHLRDDQGAGLAPVAVSDAARDLVGEPPTFTEGNSIAWRVYSQGESLALDDVHDDPDLHNPETAVQSELYLPIGDFGILIATSTTAETFDEQDVLLGEILAGNIATALEQVERTAQLRDRERELTAQNDRLEQFASVVSHDLRNPLNVAEGHLELARTDCDSEQLERVERAHDRMGTLIENLLALAREGETVPDREPIDLEALVDSCWTTVETADASLVVDVDRTVRGDEPRLKQVFENLFRNSIEHGNREPNVGAGGDESDGVTVTVGELADGFYVEDDGPGISETDRERVFEAGYSTSERGSGFGLSIVEEIVDAHGWELRVTDGEDGGVRVEITGVEFPE